MKSVKKSTYASQWKHYKEFCLSESKHPWISDDPQKIPYERAREQLMNFLDYLKPQAESYGVFHDPKSAVCWAFRVVLAIDPGKDTLMAQWMKGWKIEMPQQPRFAADSEGWDVGAIVE